MHEPEDMARVKVNTIRVSLNLVYLITWLSTVTEAFKQTIRLNVYMSEAKYKVQSPLICCIATQVEATFAPLSSIMLHCILIIRILQVHCH